MFIWNTTSWFLERVMFLVAGILIVTSVALAYYFSPLWLILPAAMGLMMILFALTGYCGSAMLISKLGFRSKYEKTKR